MPKLFSRFALLLSLSLCLLPAVNAQDHGTSTEPLKSEALEPSDKIKDGDHAAATDHAKDGGHGAGHEAHPPAGTFDAHYGTWFNPIVRMFTGSEAPKFAAPEPGKENEPREVENHSSVKYDFIFVAALIMGTLAIMGIAAGKNAKIRPEGKPTSIPNLIEAAFEGFQNYLVGIMGNDLARKYTPLIGTFFFTILLFNWMGLVPGMVAPTANPNVTIGMAIVAFFATHIIAIKEAGVKSWFMHFVGEPKWLAFLNFPLHIIGEFIKPLSLAIRLLCNVFGEEMVVIKLAGLAVATMAILKLPIPFQFPIMCLGVFFGALQALVFSTLLAIYISIFATHHDDHGHEHVEHVESGGHRQVVAHGSEVPVA